MSVRRVKIKTLARLIAGWVVSPLVVSQRIMTAAGWGDISLETHSQLLSIVPGKVGEFLRGAFLRFALEDCGPSVTIGFGVLFAKTGARIGDRVYVGPRCVIGSVNIGDDTLIGPAVQLPSGPHTHGIDRLDVPIRDQPGAMRTTIIGRDCWIGGGAIVLADVGDQAVVGAGSVVTRPVPAREIWAGNPARKIGVRGDASGRPPGRRSAEADRSRIRP